MAESNDYQEKKDFDPKLTSKRSRNITAIALFAALAIILHLSPMKIPAPYAPFLIYELWEIPIIVSFYLYGARVSLAVATINFMSLLVIFPGSLQAGPIYNLIAIFAMIFGILLAYKIMILNSKFQLNAWSFLLTMLLGISMRVLVMTVVNAVLLPMPAPLGFNAPISELEKFLQIPSGMMLLFLAFFNASLTLYTIPIARIVTIAVTSRTQKPAKYEV